MCAVSNGKADIISDQIFYYYYNNMSINDPSEMS